MDDLLREFLTETAENLDVVDTELVKLEQDPNNKDVIAKIFRLVHTVKGTCGFLGLSRLERVAHAGETLLGKFRDGVLPVTPDAVSLVLQSLDCIKSILARLEADEVEPVGDDSALIERLEAHAATAKPKSSALSAPAPAPAPVPPPAPAASTSPEADSTGPYDASLGRALKAGEVSLDELEAVFRSTESEIPRAAPKPAAAAPVSAAAKAAETAAADAGKGGDSQIANQTIRVHVDVIESLMTMVSELVLTRNQLLEMVRRIEDSDFKAPIQRLSNITAELQEGVMKTRMQPIGNAWQKLPRIVRDLGRELGKRIELEMIGAETELDRQVLELIKDPLTHMVRNSADHALELPEDRRAAGKPETGRIRLAAYHEGGHIIIEVSDDGRGLPTEKIKAKALAQGLASEADLEKMSESQLHRFIFAAGFSTASKVTNVSGRGVGMDVVRTNIEQIGGTIDLRSIAGQGTSFTIKIPLTLAIVSALIVGTAGERFAIPQLSVLELVRAKDGSEHRIEHINKTPILRLRDRLLPLVNLATFLGLEPTKANASRDDAFVVVTQVGAQIFGIVVDEVFDTEEIVVKPASTLLRNIEVFSGNTILGDGSVIMIIDPNGITSAVRGVDVESHREETVVHHDTNAEGERVSLLLFRAGAEAPRAVPLSLVTRLEEVDASKLEQTNGRIVVQYRDQLMPLVPVDTVPSARESGRQPILVFSDRGRSAGLLVDEILDIVEDRLDIELPAERSGFIGSAIVRGKATEVLDVGYFLKQAYEDWFHDTEIDARRQPRHVLFVDDSAFFRNMVQPLLSVAGYQVTTAESADAAFKLKESGARFDLIISDIEMPGMDGLAFARKLRTDPDWKDTPLVALSSRRSSEDVARGREAGFDEYLPKFDREVLIATLDQRLKPDVEAA